MNLDVAHMTRFAVRLDGVTAQDRRMLHVTDQAARLRLALVDEIGRDPDALDLLGDILLRAGERLKAHARVETEARRGNSPIGVASLAAPANDRSRTSSRAIPPNKLKKVWSWINAKQGMRGIVQ